MKFFHWIMIKILRVDWLKWKISYIPSDILRNNEFVAWQMIRKLQEHICMYEKVKKKKAKIKKRNTIEICMAVEWIETACFAYNVIVFFFCKYHSHWPYRVLDAKLVSSCLSWPSRARAHLSLLLARSGVNVNTLLSVKPGPTEHPSLTNMSTGVIIRAIIVSMCLSFLSYVIFYQQERKDWLIRLNIENSIEKKFFNCHLNSTLRPDFISLSFLSSLLIHLAPILFFSYIEMLTRKIYVGRKKS